MNQSAAHTRLVNETIRALSSYPRTRAFKFHVGTFQTPGGQWVQIGKKGMFDLLVLRGPHYIWLDAKTGGATLSKEQKEFQAMIRIVGGRAEPFHSVEEALLLVRPI